MNEGTPRTAGMCIYCGQEAAHGTILTEEHIIPLSFGGKLTLDAASCLDCQKIINKFETQCLLATMETARYHMGIRGRQKFKNRDRLPVRFLDGTKTTVPINEHPSALMMAHLAPPGLLFGLPPSNAEVAANIVIRPMTADIMERAKRLGRYPPVNLANGFSALAFARLFAKIAHSFTCAAIGLEAFRPFLTNAIRGISPMYVPSLIGSRLMRDPPANHLHTLTLDSGHEFGRPDLWVAEVRLFANIADFPTHLVVVGARTEAAPTPLIEGLADSGFVQ
jgi:hypothetical protein